MRGNPDGDILYSARQGLAMSAARLLLIGGGHAQLFMLEALRRRRQEWRGRLEVRLVSGAAKTPYSGMLPGLVAGHYQADDMHVDLQALADAAGVIFERARIASFDPVTKTALGDDGRRREFDLAALDIGSVPPLWSVPGAAEHALALKPVDAFLQAWQSLLHHAAASASPMRLVIVGGGAGGVELALAMAYRMAALGKPIKMTLATRGGVLEGFPARAARLAAQHLRHAGIGLLSHAPAVRVEPGLLHFADGASTGYDALLWATGAGAQPWVGQSGLAVIDGFAQVNAHLQSVSHPHVFAAGDIASHAGAAWPKSGVAAVRQGPVLAENLLRHACGQRLLEYRPQRDHLALISTGGRHAIACWHGLAWQGAWIWRWKDAIDRRFMRRFAPGSVKAGDGAGAGSD
jgi:pyridine nucleotide-disulfide oxidoreductase family protein